MISILKKLLSSKYKRSIKERLGVPSLHWSLQNLKKLGYNPGFVMDIGAYEGCWTRDFLEVFPSAKVLMVEAQKSKEKKIERVCSVFPSASYHIASLSGEDGKELYFRENETASHVTSFRESHSIAIKSESVDAILQRKGLPFPDFLKLDVQGYELEVLRGAALALKHAEFCLLEVSMLELFNEPLFAEVVAFMNVQGFQAYDISQLMRRPFDSALYQVDLLFIKKDSSFVSIKRWN